MECLSRQALAGARPTDLTEAMLQALTLQALMLQAPMLQAPMLQAPMLQAPMLQAQRKFPLIRMMIMSLL